VSVQTKPIRRRGILILILIMLALLTVWHRADDGAATGAPPLSLEGLLDEKLPEAKPEAELTVDNSACYVCHANLKTDALVIKHGENDVACADCHGQSLAHRNDEDNATPPDKMFGPHNIDTLCQSCHDEHDAAARKVLARWQKRCPQKTDPQTINCTDCHFHHRLDHRVVQWDKKTGKLIVQPHKKAGALKVDQ